MAIADRYLELGLRLGRHIDGLVDSYYGPPGLAERAAADEPLAADALVRRARRLIEEVGGDLALHPQRRHWLATQLVAFHTIASRLAGASLDYVAEVELCFGVRPRRLSQLRLARMHDALDEALPGRGELAARYQEWLAALTVPADKLLAALESVTADFQARSERRFGLPEGAEVEFELVSGKPWGASNTYLGGFRCRVAFNTDVGFDAPLLGQLVAHGLFPGHFSERAIKEAELVRRRGWLEETLAIATGPRVTLGEGIAETAFDVLLGDEAHHVAAEHFRALGIDYDADLVRRVWGAMGVGEQFDILTRAALLIHVDGATPAEVHDFVARWSLLPAARAPPPPATAKAAVSASGSPAATGRASAACFPNSSHQPTF